MMKHVSYGMLNMKLPKEVIEINQQLIDHFGIETDSAQPIWRVVWSEDQFEHRLGDYEDITPAGMYLRTVHEVRYVPKYKQWIQNKFILERLVLIPDQNLLELPATKKSYEVLWVFEDKNGNALPPKFEACKFIIDTVYAAQYRNHNLARYRDPDSTQEEHLENQRKRVDNLIEELFGEQSSLDYTTVTGESIVVPRNYKGSEK
jgi:hypothetical protein